MNRKSWILFLFVTASLVGCSPPKPQTTVVWISIDGFRHDYLQRYHPLTLTRLAKEGAATTQETPIFPSLTFPNHIAQVTGTTVDHHGIPMNDFYDPSSQQKISFPDSGKWLRAEPIWVTAKKQGLRVAVIDWPMSGGQTGPTASDYFNPSYDTKQTDQQRLDHVVQILKNDHDKKNRPLRLVMSYMAEVDKMGHKSGPQSTDVQQAVLETDKALDGFIQKVLVWFDDTHKPNDELYVLLTTDHGMDAVKTLVNLDRLIGVDLMQGAKIATSGPVACVYLDKDKLANADAIVGKLKDDAFLSAWKSQDVPAQYHFADPTRIGQVVVLLKPGYTFTSQRLETTRPESPGPHGMHGYDPAVDPDMLGTAIIWRYRNTIGGKKLGVINNTQWEATVAHLLGIKPAAGADPHFIDFDADSSYIHQ